MHLVEKPTLRDFQTYIAGMGRERGFADQTAPEMFILFLEECGEMAKAARKTLKMRTDTHSEEFHLDHEAADVFQYLLVICNHFGLDLEQAFRDKEELNKQRSWV